MSLLVIGAYWSYLLVWSSHNRINQIKSNIYHVRIHKRKRQRLSLSRTLLTNIFLKPCELFPPHPSHKVIVANSLMLKSYKSQNVGSLHFGISEIVHINILYIIMLTFEDAFSAKLNLLRCKMLLSCKCCKSTFKPFNKVAKY